MFHLISQLIPSFRALPALALLAGLAVAPAGAADWSGEADFAQDLRHTMAARKALQADAELAALNLGVRVEGGVAHLWGQVPAAGLAARAARVVGGVPGVRRVDSTVHLKNTDIYEPEYQSSGPARPPAAPAQPGAAGWRTDSPEPAAFPAAAPPAAPRPAGVAQAAPRETGRWTPAPAAVFGGGEEQEYGPAPAPKGGGTPPMQATTVRQSLRVSLADQVQRLKGNQPRYQALQVQVQGGRVYLDGAAVRWADVYELAGQISRVPGVEQVVVGRIQVNGSR